MSPLKDAGPVPVASPPAIDWSHLDHATMGDRALAHEVLGLFLQQVDAFQCDFDAASDAAPAMVHRLKGASRAIGAWPIAEAALALERVPHAGASTALTVLEQRIAAARTAIARALHMDGGGAGAAQIDSV